MTEREALILSAFLPLKAGAWLFPVDFGGKDGSHHSKTARRMVDKGWVERRRTKRTWRGAWEWRITAKGRQSLANHNLTSRDPLAERLAETLEG